jgi:predicted  nucleic acid-binding Zn-ribbon protein
MSNAKKLAQLLREAATLMHQLAHLIDYQQAAEGRLHEVETGQADIKERLEKLEHWAADENMQHLHRLMDREHGS